MRTPRPTSWPSVLKKQGTFNFAGIPDAMRRQHFLGNAQALNRLHGC